mgnify:FL=1
MKRFPEIARRAVSLALAASMSLSVLAPCASAAVTARDLENSVDELGNVDLTDEVFNVPGDTAFTAADTAADPLGGDDEEEIDLDDLTEEQLAEQAVVDEAGHTEHTPDTDAEPVYEQPATCAERGYAIYPCSFTLEQEDGTVAHCYHQVVVWLPLADHEWGEWQKPDDADSQKYRVCTVCNAVEYEDGTVVTPGGIPIVDPDQPEWLPGDDSQIATCNVWDEVNKVKDAIKSIDTAVQDFQKAYDAFINGNPEDMKTDELDTVVKAYEKAEKTLTDVKSVMDKLGDLSSAPVVGRWYKSLKEKVDDLQNKLNEVKDKYKAAKAELENRKNAEVAAEAAKKAVDAVETAYAALASDENLTLNSFKDVDRQITLAKNKVNSVQDDELKTSLTNRLSVVEQNVAALKGEIAYKEAKPSVTEAEDALKKIQEKAANGEEFNSDDIEEITKKVTAANLKVALLPDGEGKTALQERLDKVNAGVLALKDELGKIADVKKAELLVVAAEQLVNSVTGTPGADDIVKIVVAYNEAKKAVDALDQNREDVQKLQSRLEAVNQKVLQFEKEYVQSILEQLKTGELKKDDLIKLRDNLQKLNDYIPAGELHDLFDQVVDAVQAAIDAIDLVNEASALIKQLQEEIKNGNVSEDTIKKVQDVIDRAGALVDKIKENPILKNAVDTIIKNAEEALKEAAATKALEALKEAIESGDLSKIDEAFDQAQKAIDELRPYAPDVADKLSNALEEIKKTYLHGIKDELEKALKDGTYQEKLEKLKDVIKKYEDLIKDIDASGALKDLWETIKNEQLTKLVADAVNEINRIVNDDSLSALEKIAALDKLYDDLHTKLAEIVGPDKAAEMLEPFDKLIEQAKNDVAKAAAAAADTLIKEALKAVKAAVDSAESKEDAINKMEAIYSQAHDLLTRAGMSDEDATAKLAPVRSALDSLKKVLEDSFVSMDTIKAAVDVIVDAAVASDSIEGGLYKLVRTLLDGDDMDPAVKKVILVVARDILAKANWTQLTPSLLDDVVDLVVKKLDKKYGKYPFVSQLLNELKPSLSELVHREVGQETIDKVREVFFTTIDNAIEGIDAGQDNRQLLAKAREDLMGLKPVVSAEMKRIGTKAGEMLNREMKDRISKALPGVVIPELIGTLVGKATEDLVNEKLGEYDEKVGAIIEKYVKYLTCPGHEYEYVTIREATCTQDGVEVKQCKNCDWQLTDDDNKIVHEKLGHVVVEDPAVDPTETEEGLTAGSHCSRCGAVLEPQQVVPALQPRTDKWLVTSAVTTENIRAAGYENQQKLDAAINAVLTKAGFDAASSTRFFAQVNSTIGILPNDRYPEEGVAGMVKQPEATRNKNCTFYAVQVLTADSHGHNAGDVVVTPLTVTKEGISLTLCTEAVAAIAWKVNE